jgi:hypothetical protein
MLNTVLAERVIDLNEKMVSYIPIYPVGVYGYYNQTGVPNVAIVNDEVRVRLGVHPQISAEPLPPTAPADEGADTSPAPILALDDSAIFRPFVGDALMSALTGKSSYGAVEVGEAVQMGASLDRVVAPVAMAH